MDVLGFTNSIFVFCIQKLWSSTEMMKMADRDEVMSYPVFLKGPPHSQTRALHNTTLMFAE